MPSMGGSGRSGGDDVGGMGNNASGGGTGSGGIGGFTGGGGSNSSGNISDVTKAMLTSPTGSQYNTAFASRLPTMGEIGGTWGDFTGDLGSLMSNIGTRAYNGFLGMVDTPIGLLNRVPGVNLPTMTQKFGINTKMPALRAHDPTPYEQYRGYRDFGMTPPADVTKGILAQDKTLNPGNYGFVDSLMSPVAAMTSKAFDSVVNPLATVAMIESGLPLDVIANPFTQKTSGFLTGSIMPDIEAEALAAYAADKLGVYNRDTGYGIGSQPGWSGETRPAQSIPPNNGRQAFASRGPQYGNYGRGYLSYGNYS